MHLEVVEAVLIHAVYLAQLGDCKVHERATDCHRPVAFSIVLDLSLCALAVGEALGYSLAHHFRLAERGYEGLQRTQGCWRRRVDECGGEVEFTLGTNMSYVMEYFLPRATMSYIQYCTEGTNLVVKNFHAAAGLVQKPENLVFDVEQLLLVRCYAGDKVVVTLFELGLLQRDDLPAEESGAREWTLPYQSAPDDVSIS